jgi:hypothetical protein
VLDHVEQESAWLKEVMRMNKNKLAKRLVVIAGFLFLGAAPGLSGEQVSPAGVAPSSHITSPPVRPGNGSPPPDFFAGLTLSDGQKAKIDQIHAESKSRLELVANDNKLSPDAKDAMLRGYRWIENNKIFGVLTPEQQREVRSRIANWRASARPQQHQSQQPQRPEGNPSPSK